MSKQYYDVTDMSDFFPDKERAERDRIRTTLFAMWYESEEKNLYDPERWKRNCETIPAAHALKEFADGDFISQIILRKMEAFGLNKHIIVPIELLGIIGSCTHDNPGYAQLMLLKILNDSVYKKSIKVPYVITLNDFTDVYPDRFPDTNEYPDVELYSAMWDDQKDRNGNNNVDKVHFWYPDEATQRKIGMLVD